MLTLHRSYGTQWKHLECYFSRFTVIFLLWKYSDLYVLSQTQRSCCLTVIQSVLCCYYEYYGFKSATLSFRTGTLGQKWSYCGADVPHLDVSGKRSVDPHSRSGSVRLASFCCHELFRRVLPHIRVMWLIPRCDEMQNLDAALTGGGRVNTGSDVIYLLLITSTPGDETHKTSENIRKLLVEPPEVKQNREGWSSRSKVKVKVKYSPLFIVYFQALVTCF